MPGLEDMSENPVGRVILQLRQPFSTRLFLIGVSDDYAPTPPVDDYMTIQTIEDQWAGTPDVILAMIRSVQDDVFAGGGGGGPAGMPGYAGWQSVMIGRGGPVG